MRSNTGALAVVEVCRKVGSGAAILEVLGGWIAGDAAVSALRPKGLRLLRPTGLQLGGGADGARDFLGDMLEYGFVNASRLADCAGNQGEVG